MAHQDFVACCNTENGGRGRTEVSDLLCEAKKCMTESQLSLRSSGDASS